MILFVKLCNKLFLFLSFLRARTNLEHDKVPFFSLNFLRNNIYYEKKKSDHFQQGWKWILSVSFRLQRNVGYK